MASGFWNKFPMRLLPNSQVSVVQGKTFCRGAGVPDIRARLSAYIRTSEIRNSPVTERGLATV